MFDWLLAKLKTISYINRRERENGRKRKEVKERKRKVEAPLSRK